MTNMTPAQLRAFVLNVAGSLRSALFTGQQSTPDARVDNLFPDGAADDVRHASPFGLSSGVPKGVAAFYLGIFGSRIERIILGMLDFNRPAPAGPGETILYSTTPDGQQIKVKVTLQTDGTLLISAPTAVTIQAPKLTIGGSTTIQLGDGGEKTINGETFITDFLNHKHTSAAPGAPTSPPVGLQPAANYLSQTVKAQK